MPAVAQEETVKFEELKNKIAHGLTIDPESSYVLLVKKGVLSVEDQNILLDLWRRQFQSAVIVIQVDNPDKDIKALEIIKK